MVNAITQLGEGAALLNSKTDHQRIPGCYKEVGIGKPPLNISALKTLWGHNNSAVI